MKGIKCTRVSGVWILAAALFPPSAAQPGSAPDAGVKQEGPQQLDEILVEGRKPIRDAQAVFGWMSRLVGRFIVEGKVDLHGNGGSVEPLEAQGRADCVGFGAAPAVTCDLKIRWPETKGPNGEALLGGVSTLDPASMLFGFAPDRIGIRHMLADSSGVANDALGYLITSDTWVARTKCVGVAGHCERRVQITAEPERNSFEMTIELEVEYQRAVSFTFLMRRVPGSPAIVMPGGRHIYKELQ